MWFGIESVGLCKYDGQDYVIYENLPEDSSSISNNFPTKIIEDKTGIVWVGTLNGLNKFNRKDGTFKRYFHDPGDSNSITDNAITDLHIDNYGYLWIATSGGLSKCNIMTEELIHLLPQNNSQSDKIYVADIYEDDEGNIWIGTWQKGMFFVPANINYLHSKEWNTKPVPQIATRLSVKTSWMIDSPDKNYLIQSEIRRICNADNGILWISTSKGLYLFDISKDKLTHWKFKDKETYLLNEADFNAIYPDSKGLLWAGTTSNGLVIIDLKHKKHTYLDADLRQINGLKSNSIRDICEDKSGLIWIGTKFQGIQIYDRRQEIFGHIQENSKYVKGLSNSFVLSVIEDSDHIIWIGTKEGGLNRYNPENGDFKYFQNIPGNRNSIGSNRIEFILEDVKGNLWLATPTGLDKFNKQKQVFEHYGNLNIMCLEQGVDDKIWIGTLSSGVFIFDPLKGNIERFSSKYKQLSEVNGFRITRIFKDKNGHIWIGTGQNGLYKYFPANDSLVHYLNIPENEHSISGNMIRSIFEDTKGYLWIGTKSGGLNRLDPQTGIFHRINIAEGLPSNTVYSILEDKSGNLWMGTHNGITRYNPENESFVSFSESYGLQGKVFEINAHCKDANGMMYFGGSNGLNVFSPDSTFKAEYAAPLIVSSVQIFDRIIAVDITEYLEIILSTEDKYISFNYSILDYSDPVNKQYRYMLEDFDNDWIYSRNRHYATYTSLPPGEYLFKVQGLNPDGYWTDNSISIKLVVPKPYWRQWWFIASLIFLIITLIIAAYLLRVSFVRRNEKRLMNIVKQKTKDLREANEILEIQKTEIEKHNEELIRQRNKISLQNKELEQHRLHLEKLVSERTKDLEDAKIKAEESDRLKSAFLSNMCHEIRTPLNAIVGFTDLVANEEFGKDELKHINNIIKTNSNALLQLINDIINISKIEANQVEIHPAEFYINEFLHRLFQTYQTQIISINPEYQNSTRLQLYLDITNEDLKIVSDPFRIEQILNNLFSNANKFTKSGTIEMGYRIMNHKSIIRFFMKDSGIGIAKENIEIVFDRFRKIEDDKTKLYRGTGLGLSISSNLARLLGGELSVESEIGKGSMFYFDLPLVIAGSKVRSQEKVMNPEKPLPYWNNKTILLVEDEDSNFKVLKTMLGKTGLRIKRAKDGLSAVKLCTGGKYTFDLVLMDIKLPGMNGIEATRKIKEFNQSMPIIAQTAYAMFNEEKEIMKAGFNDYLTKPILASVLIEK
ncbi:MAG TPA: two-component regulator propeller domain-containing protein, partial [Bacteroidales bacterium]|nr:two-component regulator propeller domain-containing protein [Bacteroidales bacterium]